MAGRAGSDRLRSLVRDLVADEMRQHVTGAVPGRVVSYNAQFGTATVAPSTDMLFKDLNGNVVRAKFPTVPNVPVFLPAGANGGLGVDVKAGDAVLLLPGNGDIDDWKGGSDAGTSDDVRWGDPADLVALLVRRPGPAIPTTSRASNATVLAGTDVRVGNATTAAALAFVESCQEQLDDLAEKLNVLLARYNVARLAAVIAGSPVPVTAEPPAPGDDVTVPLYVPEVLGTTNTKAS